MSGWPAYVAETLFATTVLMAAVLLLRAPVRRAFGAGAAYALWLVPALRLVAPSFDILPAAPASVAASPVAIAWAFAPAQPAGTSWLPILWAAGALLFAGWHVVAYRRFLRRALAGATIAHDGVALVTTSAVGGPAATGLLTRRILLPRDFIDRFDPAERALALRHERAHHARGDLWANAAALGMLSLHWFNPLAHRAHRAFREDQELACDAAVIGTAGSETRAAYAAAMVKSAWGRAPLTTCPMSRTGSIKRRLKMVGTHRKSVFASAAGMATTAALALGGLMLTAGGAAAQATDPIVKQETIIIKGGNNTSAEVAKLLDGKCAAANRTEYQTPGAAGAKPTRVIMCNRTGVTSADAGALQKARDRLAASSDLSADRRAQVLGALDEALAKARAR